MSPSVCGFSLQPMRFALFLAWFAVRNTYIVGLIQVWELAYRQCPFGLIDTKGNEKNIFQKKIIFRSIWGRLFILKAVRVRIFPTSVDIRGKNVFFSKFCIQNAALQNGDILGSNNRTETVDTAMKIVDDKILKNEIFKDH